MATKQHAVLAASGAHRWTACPGSIRMSKGISESSSPAALQGTRAHALGEQILRYWLKTKEPENGLRARWREGTSFKWNADEDTVITDKVDQETLDYVMVHVNYVTSIMTKKSKLYLEEALSLEHIRPDMGGTADVVIVSPELFHVIDYKHGYVAVQVCEVPAEWSKEVHLEHINKQLLMYAAGALYKFKIKRGPVQLTIVQPRSMENEDVQSIILNAADILEWAENWLWEKACNTEMGDAPLVAGSHCRFCPAAGKCPELAKKSMSEASLDFADVVEAAIVPQKPQVPLDPKALSRILKAAPMIDAWLRECEATAQAVLERGGGVDGFKLVRKKSNRAWPTEDPKELMGLLKKAGMPIKTIDMLTKTTLMSPKQLEDATKNKVAISQVALKPDNGLTLAAASDKREGVKAAITDFSDLL